MQVEDGVYYTCSKWGPQIKMEDRIVTITNGTVRLVNCEFAWSVDQWFAVNNIIEKVS